MTRDQQTTPLGHVIELVMGQAPPSKDCNFTGTGTPFVKVGEFGIDRPVIREWTTNPLRMARKTDVLLCVVGATCGKINLGEDCAIGRSVAAIRPKASALDQYYLYYFMMTLVERLRSGSIGAAQTVISKDMISSVEIPLPPLPEQHRIVSILDEAFDGIATAKANSEKNLQNARAIFESHLDEVLSRSGAGYTATTLGAEVNLLPGYAFPSSGYTDAIDAVRLLRGDNIMQGYFRWEEVKGWPSNDFKSYSKFALQEGDVVIAMDRPWVKAGLKRAQLCTDDLPALLVQRTSRLRTLGRVRMDFLSHLTGSQSFSRHLLKVQTGIGVPHISGKQIESYKFMLPPMSDQESIACTLNELLLNTKRLEDIYGEKLVALDELKKSLLHQAFTGQL
jgi:type I restriction enzyme, S subunit